MKNITSAVVAALATAIAPITISDSAIAQTYGAQYFGASTSLSWILYDATLPTDRSQPSLLSYMCVTRDALGAMANTAVIERYAVYLRPNGKLLVEPLSAVIVQPLDGGYMARSSDVYLLDDLMAASQADANGDWLLSEYAPAGIEEACLNGGVAGALDELEASHGIYIQQQ